MFMQTVVALTIKWDDLIKVSSRSFSFQTNSDLRKEFKEYSQVVSIGLFVVTANRYRMHTYFFI